MTARRVAALLSLVGLFVSLYLTLYHYGVIGTLSCSVGSCETVQTSRYAMLMGVPVAAWGVASYVVMLALAMASDTDRWADSRAPLMLLAAVSGWGLLFSAYLTYLELFVIHAICQWCVISAILVTGVFVASVVALRGIGTERRA